MEANDDNIEYENVEPLNADEKTLYEFGETAAKKFGYKIGGELDEDFIKKINGELEYIGWVKYKETAEGSIEVHGKEANPSFRIYLPRFTGYLKNCFTIAHELGHYVLHSRLGEKKIQATRHGKGDVEYEANCFAAAFLMPGEEFKKDIKDGLTIDQLAEKYNVSTYAAKYRYNKLT